MENAANTKTILPGSELFYHLNFETDLKTDHLNDFQSGFHLGQFACLHETGPGVYEAVRDPLGIGKLFYTETPDGELHFSSRFVDLFPRQSEIFSVPKGKLVRIGKGGQRELIRDVGVAPSINEDLNLDAFENPDNVDVQAFQTEFDSRLEALFKRFKEYEDSGWTFFLALSGGLDSTIIASKASRHLNRPVAATLDLGKSEDSEKSQKTAGYLGLKHLVFPTDETSILEALEIAPGLCQDFRDFNVHCAALNILLAESIKQHVDTDSEIDPQKVIVLTGDLMNEFTCDYATEVIDGVEYYKLPRVHKKALQRHLIKGLDTSDREISVFQAYGLNCVQPFAALYDLYESVHESVLSAEDPKKLLNSFQVDSTILDFIPKEKLRAQVGSRENMGILGLCHHKGLNNDTFRQKLLEDCGHSEAEIPIFIGRYNVESFK